MGGGLMQLVAYGAQDIYLTGNPQITFFKVVYRKHTNFSMEAIVQTFSGGVGFGNDVVATISRNGDLVHRMYVEFNPLELFPTTIAADSQQADVNIGVTANLGNALVKECEIEIGGQRIDKHYGHWLTTWDELTEFNPTGSKGGLHVSTVVEPGDHGTLAQRMSFNHKGCDIDRDAYNAATQAPPTKAFVPLQFWFCRNPGLALPLIALQYHEVKVKISFPSIEDLYEPVGTSGVGVPAHRSLSDVKLYADYIYLDTDERRRFAQVSHEYLIEQLQYESFSGTTLDLNFNHPVKELIFTGAHTGAITSSGDIGPSTPSVISAADKIHLKLNGHDRFSARDYRYFTRTQVWQHHTGYGGTTVPDSIVVYSFALKPEEHQPSGTCNFSRIDNAQLKLGGSVDLNIYAVNYNVLRIMSGMGGLAYSN